MESKNCIVDYLKNIEFHHKKISVCFPVSRKEKLEDIISSGKVDKAWFIPGHIFVLYNDKQQLSTFDCKPAHLQQYEDTVFLDFVDITSPIVDIVTADIYHNVIFIIFKNGTVQLWQYTDSQTWTSIIELNILHTDHSEIISFCVHDDHSAIYWCEKHNTTVSICKRTLPSDLEEKSIGKAEVILSNCPVSDIFNIKDFLAIVIRQDVNQVPIKIIWRPSSDHLILFIDGTKHKIDSCWTNQTIDFKKILLRCIPVILQWKLPFTKNITIQDSITKELLSIGNDGKSQIVNVDLGEIGRVSMTPLDLPNDINVNEANCFLSNGFLGVCGKFSVKIYSLHTGKLLQNMRFLEHSVIIGPVKCSNQVYTGAILTQSDFFIIQKTTHVDQLVSELSDNVTFQTDALEYAKYSQIREEDEEIRKKLENLKIKWYKEKDETPKSQLIQTIGPFIEEFWRLEELTGSKMAKTQIKDIETEIEAILTENVNQPLAWQQSKLMILCEKFPSNTLQMFLTKLNFHQDCVNDVDMLKWKKVLGLDVTDPGSQKSFIFNQICRLIYKLYPEYLVKFVNMAQQVSERNIGVSAFVRKRHLLQYYQKALDCLPDPMTSTQPKLAVLSTSQLLLASGDKNCLIKAVRYLLQHEEWNAVFKLLQDNQIEMKQKSMLLYLLVTHLTQKGNLSEYKKDLSHLIPNKDSCINIKDIFEESENTNLPTKSPEQPAISSIQPLLKDLFLEEQ
ncbi:hypothetical protein LOTGIDRAFT_235003 [Lottia gigantea]|uniref:Uncharacterized protein n=1 Tax=Lottia gigantea TaxID=225164 RepID=V4A2I2_LOTGI|nr:hypothetical protein LOTGIDRAFT_235003 [Lottia gigantea]ESO87506.1 hypothetical protein LOTGIDRAFT_235003 [Lottia gigantea]